MKKTTRHSPKMEAGPVPRVSFSIDEAASALGIGRTYVFQLIREDRLRVVRLGRRTLVPLESLLELLKTPVSGAPRPLPMTDDPAQGE